MKRHLYTRFAEALIRVEHGLESNNALGRDLLIAEIEKGLNAFKISPTSNIEGKQNLRYDYIRELKGSTSQGFFLAPNIISKEQQARHIWNESHSILDNLKDGDLDKVSDVGMSIAPVAGEFLNFSGTSAGRGKPKSDLRSIALNAITSLTITKPCFQYTSIKKGGSDRDNCCLIPDLPIEQLMDFVWIYKRIIKSKSTNSLMVGDVIRKIEGKGKGERITYVPKRPQIFRGNFPNPPRSSALGSIAILAAIGEFSRESEVSNRANKVLDSLKKVPIYLIKYGDAASFTYNHYVVELAKTGKLRQLVDGIYYSQLYNEGRRSSKSPNYQKFDLFASRYLHSFNEPAFKDFLAFRAEYPQILELLFVTYFNKIMMIDPQIVSSARKLGKWLNQVAYFAAKNEIKQSSPNYWDELRKAKSKVLIELESSTFSAKTGDALIAQAVTRAGRISGMDAPEGAALFMEKTSSGELSIDNAKNLLIAFSRLKNKAEQKDLPKNELMEDEDDLVEESEDLSNE